MARWALSPIIGDGTAPRPDMDKTNGPYRAAAGDHGGHVAVIASNTDGTPRFGWALVRFADAADMAAAQADDRLRVLPDWTPDHVITAGEAAAIANALDHFGITGYPNPTGRTLRQVVRWVADKLDVTWQVG